MGELTSLLTGRIEQVRKVCQESIELDHKVHTERRELAEFILNILDGVVDGQITREQHTRSRYL